jgi:hypothetical protein
MRHLMDQHPVPSQIVLGGIAPQHQANGRAAITPCGAAAHARAIDRHDQELYRFDWKPAVIGRDRLGRCPDEVQYPVPGQRNLAGRKRHMHHAAGNIDVGLGKLVEGIVRHPVTVQFRLRLGARCEQAGQQQRHDSG